MKKLEKIVIEVKDGNRRVEVNGEELNLGEITSMDISFEGDTVAIKTAEKKHFEW